ncbi:BTB/POZ domain-containing protein 19-like [Asterias rubens]|uniref:BTB/POZ domain-containing protein 19-like n=1 Tax=Asterias rubens TaxID=7604 RepID=UPI0014550C6C|nr:BTB/POZ domain-containing protein 19-like [Asterias rubens]
MDLIDSGDFIRGMASHMAFLAALQEHQIEDTEQFDDPSQDQDETQPSDHLLLKLSPFFDSGSLSDITLMVGSSIFHAHKLILSSWSPVFKEMLLKRSNSDEPHVLEDDQEYEVIFSDFLKFMYTETIEISKDTVYSFIKLSKKYEVDEICELCEEFLIGEVSNDTIALQTLTDAEEFGFTKMYDHCFKFLETNFFHLSDSSLQKMGPSLFLKMLESSDLVVLSERHLFNQAVDWLYTGGHDYDKYTKEVISKIHFTHMSSLDLCSLKRGITAPAVMSDRSLQIQSSLNDSGLQDSIHDAFEWKALVSEEKELSLLPCDTKSTLSKKHCVEPRICISGPVSSNYQHLSLSGKKTQSVEFTCY